MAAPDPPGGKIYKLSTELMPGHEGGVQALAVLSDDVIVTGGDDRMVTVWHRLPASREFASVHMATEHENMVRSIIPVPACAALPKGGFATACLDKHVRLYAFDPVTRKVDLVRVLRGHVAGVISLSLTVTGELISGGWEGHARVWDMATGRCIQVLEGHENGTRVCGLPDGAIAVGSTGRKDEFNRHVDYKIRIWTQSTVGGKTAYSISKVISDHEQAVQDLDALPGIGFVSASNDGTVKVRAADGDVLETFANPVSPEGKPYSAFRARVLPSGLIASCNEDNVVRLYSSEAPVDEVVLPGQPWTALGFTNGDVVVVGNQAGTSRRGHIYVFTADASRYANELDAARFTKDMEPPAKARAPEGGDDGMGDAGGDVQISGPYEQRAGVPGTTDGQYGFFKRADGVVMVCGWSAAAGCWTDIGEMTDGPTGGDHDIVMDPGARAGGGGGKKWDYTVGVTLDTAGGGLRSMQLCFDEEDDVITVAKEFIQHNGLSDDSYEEVKNFIIEQKMTQGEGVRARKRAAAAKAAGSVSAHFPAKTYLDLAAADFKKVWPKLTELNAALAAEGNAAALDAGELEALKAVVDVLTDTARYHATRVPRKGVAVLVRKGLSWPPARAFPCVDVLRVLVCHPDGAAAVADPEVCPGGFLPKLLAAAKAALGAPEHRPVVLLAARALFNALRHEPTRRALAGALGDVLDAASDLVAYEHATVKFAAAVLLHNVAYMLWSQAQEAQAKPGAAAGAGVNADAAAQALALIAAALPATKEDEAVAKLLVALGTLASLDRAVARQAKDMDLSAAVEAAQAGLTAQATKDAARDVLALLAKA